MSRSSRTLRAFGRVVNRALPGSWCGCVLPGDVYVDGSDEIALQWVQSYIDCLWLCMLAGSAAVDVRLSLFLRILWGSVVAGSIAA